MEGQVFGGEDFPEKIQNLFRHGVPTYKNNYVSTDIWYLFPSTYLHFTFHSVVRKDLIIAAIKTKADGLL